MENKQVKIMCLDVTAFFVRTIAQKPKITLEQYSIVYKDNTTTFELTTTDPLTVL